MADGYDEDDDAEDYKVKILEQTVAMMEPEMMMLMDATRTMMQRTTR